MLLRQAEAATSALTKDTRAEKTAHAHPLARSGLLFTPRLSSAYYQAFKTSLDYQFERWIMGVAYERIDPGYRTLGAYYFNNDLENVTVAHPRMTAAEWQQAYRDVWNWYYTDEHVERLMKRNRLTIRPLDMKRLDEEVATIQRIYNTAWERNWGFVPMSGDEIAYMAKQLKPVVNPNLCGMAEIDGEAIGFILGLPDYNQALKHVDGRLFPVGLFKLLWYRRKINAIRVITLGLRPEFRGKGIDALLILHVFREAQKLGMARGECSWILEDNMPMRLALEKIGGTAYTTYRVYEKPLGN